MEKRVGLGVMRRAPLRLGLLGTGVAAWRLYKSAFEGSSRRLELVACSNRTRSKAEKYAKATGFSRVEDSAEALFSAPDVDAVLISLPIDVQPTYVLAALRAGKAVLSEKPIAANVAQAKQLMSDASASSIPWMVGENYAFMSHVRKLQALVAANAFGNIRLIEARQVNRMDASNPYFNTEWRAAPKHVGGFVVDGGVHIAHVIHRCFGRVRVEAALQASFDPQLPPMDTALALLRFESGAVGTWTSCFSARDVTSPLVRVLGEKANGELFGNRLEVTTPRGKISAYGAKGDSFAAQFLHFADVVQSGQPCDVPPSAALADLELVTAVCSGRVAT